MQPLIEATDLNKSYRRRDGTKESVIAGLNLDIQGGEFVALLGMSGVGKSTLLRILSGIERPDSGTVRYLLPPTHSGGDLVGCPPAEAARRGLVGSLFQRPPLLPWRTVAGNVHLVWEICGRRPGQKDTTTELLEQVGLEPSDARKYPDELSGGMRQRVSLAMLLARSPQVLCLDEPFGALDALTRQEMYSLLLSLWDGGAPSALGGRTVVLITHDVHEAILLADRLLIAQRRPVTDVVSVDVSFPRPRTFDRMFDSDARAVAEHVFQLLLPLSAMH